MVLTHAALLPPPLRSRSLIPTPYVRIIPGRPLPPPQRPQYVVRPFIKDAYMNTLQHVENRGMYREELALERSRFPRMQKTLVIHTDGSLSEREFEMAVPPVVVLFADRNQSFRDKQLACVKIRRHAPLPFWNLRRAFPLPQQPVCNAVAFPWCVPALTPLRRPLPDALSFRYDDTVAELFGPEGVDQAEPASPANKSP